MATITFQKSEAILEGEHGHEGDADAVITFDTTDGPWVQLTYESLRTQDGAAIAVLDDCGCWVYEDKHYSDVVITFDSQGTP